jgi:hypothetical protein
MKDTSIAFFLGRIVMTPSAHAVLTQEDIHNALARHLFADWGDVCAEDWTANDEALDCDARLHSVYHNRDGTKFWVITEADRSVTTLLLPEDY